MKKNVLYLFVGIAIIGAGLLAYFLTKDSGPSSFTSEKGVVINLDEFQDGQTVASPLTITGEVPGSWSFEASFPVSLLDADGTVLAEDSAELTGDWMTEELVPFEVTLVFTAPTDGGGTLVLEKDNPSGETANEDSIEIEVSF